MFYYFFFTWDAQLIKTFPHLQVQIWTELYIQKKTYEKHVM